MKVKRLIMALVLVACIMGSALLPGANISYAAETDIKTDIGIEVTLDDLNNIPEEGKVIIKNENSITTIRPVTEEEVIMFIMEDKGVTYEEAKKLYEEQKEIRPMERDEVLREAILTESYPRLWGSIGLELNVWIEYVYNIAEREVVAIEKYLGSIVDTIGAGASLAYFEFTDGPEIDVTWYRVDVSYYGYPVIEVTEEVSASLSAFGFIEVGA